MIYGIFSDFLTRLHWGRFEREWQWCGCEVLVDDDTLVFLVCTRLLLRYAVSLDIETGG